MSISLDSIDSVSTDQLKLHDDEETSSFLRRLAKLVACVYVTFSQISQNDRKEVVSTEKEIKMYTHLSADKLSDQGNWTLATAVMGVVFFTASFAWTHKNDQSWIQNISSFAPKVGELFSLHKSGSVKSYDAIVNIKQTKLQDKSSKAQSEGNTKEAFAQVLQAELRRWDEMKMSSRGG